MTQLAFVYISCFSQCLCVLSFTVSHFLGRFQCAVMDSYNGRASNFETVIKGDLKLLFNPYLFTFVLMNCLFYPVIHS